MTLACFFFAMDTRHLILLYLHQTTKFWTRLTSRIYQKTDVTKSSFQYLTSQRTLWKKEKMMGSLQT